MKSLRQPSDMFAYIETTNITQKYLVIHDYRNSLKIIFYHIENYYEEIAKQLVLINGEDSQLLKKLINDLMLRFGYNK